MSTFTQNRRLVLLTLLAFLASAICASAQAQPAVFFERGCNTCHGPTNPIDPNNTTHPERFATNGALTSYISSSMPPTSPGSCIDACAQSIADFFVPPTPPTANASNSTNLSGTPPLTATLNGSASTDDQGIVAYAWNFGDGTTGTGVTTTHTYTAVNTYTVTLTVTDTRGLQDTDTVMVNVTAAPIPPTADASETTPLSGAVPLHVVFDSRTSQDDEGIVSYNWNFGDGNTDSSTVGVKVHTYTAVGTYTATLTVTDTDGLQDTTTLTITVRQPGPPTADLGASSNLKGAAPLNAQLSPFESSCEGLCTYNWNFGDGETTTTDSNFTVPHIYTTPGTYTATLTITTSNGLMDSDTVQVKVAQGESLAQYVAACKTQVGFTTLPDINCYDGILFAQSNVDGEEDNLGATRDFVGYKRITNDIDLAVACRWLGAGDRLNPGLAASVEMLVHNRINGNTCFFSAKANSGSPDPNINVASVLASPTAANASNFWDDPGHVDGSGRRCVECHVAGPIIASPRVADELGILGLLNNGHDTFSTRYKAVTPPGGGAFSFWNEIVQDNNVADTCASGCHTVGHDSTILDVLFIQPVLLPSISTVIDKVIDAGVMPPNGAASPYRWINRDSINGSGDQETFSESKTEYPKLLEYCGAPTFIEAHAVGSDINFSPKLLPDKLSMFNLRDGLVCLNSDQESGVCNDYKVRYQCTAPNGNKTWTNWYNTDSPSFDGDHEERSRATNLCASPTGSTVTAIEAGVTLSNGWTYTSYGPNDRLAQFNEYGLVCNNADQPTGQCSNYVVRFSNCTAAPSAYTARLTNAWSGRLLTATATTNDAETRAQPANSGWTSQNWTIEPVTNTGYVRLKNVWNGRYLNVQSNTESSNVMTYDLVPEWTSMQWSIEPISGSTDVRLRNVWSGRYLTIVDTGNYSAIRSQTLNRGWASQRWRVQ